MAAANALTMVTDVVEFQNLRDGPWLSGKVMKRRGTLVQVTFTQNGTAKMSWICKWREPANAAGSPVSEAAEMVPKRRMSVAATKGAESNIKISNEAYMAASLSVVVVGASGDLAKKKTYPALFDLFSHGHLPMDVSIIGVARSALTDESLRGQLRTYLEKLSGGVPELIDLFLSRCAYRQMKSYADLEAMTSLDQHLTVAEAAHPSGVANRLFYFAIPPNVFLDTAATIKASAVSASGFTRLIVEKPFGHDLKSAQELAAALGAIFDEDRIYRIDHYLGKEMVQNMIVMRFGNVLFRNVWDRRSISSVQITFKEDFGTMGRGGYFDNYGIIRDIMQNHLMQVMALAAMDEPSAVFGPESGKAVRDAKVAVIKKILPIRIENVVLGQYGADPSGKEPGYLDDPTVPKGSKTPTFAMAVMYIDNERWAGVPFIMKAGKALNERKAELRIQLCDVPGAHSTFDGKPVPRNEMVIRLQPEEAVYVKANVKSPGLNVDPMQVELDLSYKGRFYTGEDAVYSPDAYTRLLLDTLMGKQSAFVRDDELLEAWKVFGPLLEQIEAGAVPLHTYDYGSRGPVEADALVGRIGITRNSNYLWRPHGKL